LKKIFPGFGKNNDAKKDWLNVVEGTVAQMILVVLPIYVVLMQLIPYTCITPYFSCLWLYSQEMVV